MRAAVGRGIAVLRPRGLSPVRFYGDSELRMKSRIKDRQVQRPAIGREPRMALTGPLRPAHSAPVSTKYPVRSRGGMMSVARVLGQPFLVRVDHLSGRRGCLLFHARPP